MTESDRPEQELVANLEEHRHRLGNPEHPDGPAAWKPPDGHFRTLFESAPIGIARLDGLGRLLDGNLALQRLFGFSLEECRGRPLTDFAHPNEGEAERMALRELQEGRRAHYHVERQYRQKDGGLIWISTKISCGQTAHGEPVFFVATLEDVSERRQAEEGLRLSNRRLTAWTSELEQRSREISLLSEMGDLFQACRSAEDAYAVISRVGRQLFPTEAGAVGVFRQPHTVETVAVLGTPITEKWFAPEECWALRRGRLHAVEDAQIDLICKHLHRPQSYMCLPMVAHGEALGVFHVSLSSGGRFTESQRRLAITVAEHTSLAVANLRLHETLSSQSIRDPLTGLFNRRYMEESLEREVRRAGRYRHSVGIIMLDLDHFKRFNDTYGHPGGDALLRELGAMLQRSIRGGDIACRYGGEEFTLILPEVTIADAGQRAEHLREAIKTLRAKHHRQPLGSVTVSAGVATYPENGSSGDAVLRAADAALYQAKAGGRDQVGLNRSGFYPPATTPPWEG